MEVRGRQKRWKKDKGGCIASDEKTGKINAVYRYKDKAPNGSGGKRAHPHTNFYLPRIG